MPKSQAAGARGVLTPPARNGAEVLSAIDAAEQNLAFIASLKRALSVFVSPTWVEQAIVFACRDIGHPAAELPLEMHAELVQQVMLRARTFADPARLPDMMLAVAEIFEDESQTLAPPTTDPGLVPTGVGEHDGAVVRVLVVDDDAISRHVLAAMLTATGALVDTASSGREAVERLRDGSFDVVCMDCYMPELSGFQATQLIRREAEQEDRARVYIVAITGQNSASTREHARRVGVDDLLVKPVTRAALTTAVIMRRPSFTLEAPLDCASTR